MARISELHYSNAYAASSGVAEFIEIALEPGDIAADFTVSFYQANGDFGVEFNLVADAVPVTLDPETNERVYVISASAYPILLTDPDGGASNNYEAYALTNVATGTVIDFYDIGGGTTGITADGGAADGAQSENLTVADSPRETTTSIQFNKADGGARSVDAPVTPGDTGLACFVAGSWIDTPGGFCAIEELRVGDWVSTLDNGPQRIRWIGASTVSGFGAFAPVCIQAGTLGATSDIYVSQQHRLFLAGWEVELFYARDSILVPAKSLIGRPGIALAPRHRVTYLHMLFDTHQIVRASGVMSESFFPGDAICLAGQNSMVSELIALFPELATDPASYGATAREVVRTALVPALLVA